MTTRPTPGRPPDRRRARERGAELVEFALVLPLLLVILGGIVDFGLMLHHSQVLANAAREGARLAVLPGYSEADVTARVLDYVRAGTANSSAVLQNQDVLRLVNIAPTDGPAFQAARVRVVLRDRFLILGPIVNLIGGNWTYGAYLDLQGTSTMRIEAPAGS